MNKSNILIKIAALPEDDPTIETLGDLLGDKPQDGRPSSLRLLRISDAARESGLSRQTLWRMIRDGRLRAVEIRTGNFRVPETELFRIVEGRPA